MIGRIAAVARTVRLRRIRRVSATARVRAVMAGLQFVRWCAVRAAGAVASSAKISSNVAGPARRSPRSTPVRAAQSRRRCRSAWSSVVRTVSRPSATAVPARQHRQVERVERLGAHGDPGFVGGGDLRDGAEAGDAAAVHDGHMVGEFGGLVEVVGGEHDRGAALGEFAQQRPGAPPRRRVEAGRRLVREQHRRVRRERQREVEAAPLAARERRDAHAGSVGEVDAFDEFRAGGQAVQVGPQSQGLAHREVVGEAGLLADHGDGAGEFAAVLPGVAAEDVDGARGGAAQPHRGLDGGGLPGAVGAEEREELAGGDGEGDAVDGGEGPVAAGEVADLDGGAGLRG